MTTDTRQSSLALVFVGALLLFLIGGAGIIFKFSAERAESANASAVIDGIEPTPGGKTLYAGEGSICKAVFTEPFETVCFLFRDGSFLTFTTQDDRMIDAPIAILLAEVSESGRFIEDCLLIVHNHFTPVGFSPGDMRSYHYLRDKGFRGVFGIYYTTTGRFLGLED